MLEEETGGTDAIAAVSKNKKKITKPSTKARGKKGPKQAKKLELDELVQRLPPDKEAEGNDDFTGDDFTGEEAPKVTSKKKAPQKPKTKQKVKRKGKAILSESENEEDHPPRSKPPIRCSELPEDQESIGGSPQKEVITAPEISQVLHFDNIRDYYLTIIFVHPTRILYKLYVPHQSRLRPPVICDRALPPSSQSGHQCQNSSGVSTHSRIHRSEMALPIRHC